MKEKNALVALGAIAIILLLILSILVLVHDLSASPSQSSPLSVNASLLPETESVP